MDLPMLSETKESNQGVSEDERRRIPGEVTALVMGAEIKGGNPGWEQKSRERQPIPTFFRA